MQQLIENNNLLDAYEDGYRDLKEDIVRNYKNEHLAKAYDIGRADNKLGYPEPTNKDELQILNRIKNGYI